MHAALPSCTHHSHTQHSRITAATTHLHVGRGLDVRQLSAHLLHALVLLHQLRQSEVSTHQLR